MNSSDFNSPALAFGEEEAPPLTPGIFRSGLERVLRSSSSERSIGTLILFNFILQFTRPQNNLPILGTIGLIIAFSLIGLGFWLTRTSQTWTTQTKAIVLFLIYQAVFIIIGKVGYDPLVRNDFWAFQTWRDLLQQFTCYFFPMIVYFTTGSQLRRLVKTLLLISIYAGLYAFTHQGKGPGAFLEDENDFCMLLVMFLPFSLMMLPIARSSAGKLMLFAIALWLLGGVVITESRGGFVGLVFALGYIYWKSPAKVAMTLGTIVICVLGVLAVPTSYWSEIKTIENVNEGTAKSRTDIWKVAFSVFKDPRHTITGVGLSNTGYWLADFEPVQNRTAYGKSISGRAIHSMYFQLLGDLGLIGIIFLYATVGVSFRKNARISKRAKLILSRSDLLFSNTGLSPNSDQLEFEPSWQEQAEDIRWIRSSLKEECKYIVALSTCLNAAILGVLVCGAFISILYYPPIWFLVCASVTLQFYWQKLQNLVQTAEHTAIPLRSKELDTEFQ